MITFDLENHVPRFPPQIYFVIQFIIKGKAIHQIFVDEGASTCIMSISRWKAIGSPPLNLSPNTLESFDGWGFYPYGILNSLSLSLCIYIYIYGL